MSKRHVLFVNGDLEHLPALREEIKESDYIIGVDGGTRHVLALGLLPHVVIGDLDSIGDDALALIRGKNVPTIEHPARKDHSDLELALIHSVKSRADEIVVVSALGGRFDHTLANTLLLGSPLFGGTPAQLYDGRTRAKLLRPGELFRIAGTAGQTFSLLPLSADVEVEFLRGAEWNLQSDVLHLGSSRGLSNLFNEPWIEIQIRSGSLLFVTTIF